MDADYTAWASALAAFSTVVSCLFIVIMANAQRNADLSPAIFRLLWTGCRFTARIINLFFVLHKCNVWIYVLSLLTQVDFFGTTFYFLESRKFSFYFYFLKSRIFGMYFYFLESSKVIYFWQHCIFVDHSVAYTSGRNPHNRLMQCLLSWEAQPWWHFSATTVTNWERRRTLLPVQEINVNHAHY